MKITPKRAQTKREKNQKANYSKQNNLQRVYRLFLYLFFAQSRNFFNRGKYSANIIKPGIPKTQPWKTGISPPIIPIKTKRTPKVILSECLIIYILVTKLLFKSIL